MPDRFTRREVLKQAAGTLSMDDVVAVDSLLSR